MRLYATGDRVTQGHYGDGTVSFVNQYHTKIDFDDHGLRTFASSQVVLVRSTSMAPQKIATPRRKRRATATA